MTCTRYTCYTQHAARSARAALPDSTATKVAERSTVRLAMIPAKTGVVRSPGGRCRPVSLRPAQGRSTAPQTDTVRKAGPWQRSTVQRRHGAAGEEGRRLTAVTGSDRPAITGLGAPAEPSLRPLQPQNEGRNIPNSPLCAQQAQRSEPGPPSCRLTPPRPASPIPIGCGNTACRQRACTFVVHEAAALGDARESMHGRGVECSRIGEVGNGTNRGRLWPDGLAAGSSSGCYLSSTKIEVKLGSGAGGGGLNGI